jgi:hypothetical protein
MGLSLPFGAELALGYYAISALGIARAKVAELAGLPT